MRPAKHRINFHLKISRDRSSSNWVIIRRPTCSLMHVASENPGVDLGLGGESADALTELHHCSERWLSWLQSMASATSVEAL